MITANVTTKTPHLRRYRRDEITDNHRLQDAKVKRLFNYTMTMNSIMLKLNMRYEGIRDLIMIIIYYKQYGSAINRYTLTQITSEFNTTTYQAGTKRINCMLAKNLIIRSGHGKYIPTQKAIGLLNSITL